MCLRWQCKTEIDIAYLWQGSFDHSFRGPVFIDGGGGTGRSGRLDPRIIMASMEGVAGGGNESLWLGPDVDGR